MSSMFNNKYKILFKAIAIVLVCLFLANYVAWAQPKMGTRKMGTVLRRGLTLIKGLAQDCPHFPATLAAQSIFNPIINAVGIQHQKQVELELRGIIAMALRGLKREGAKNNRNEYISFLNINSALDKRCSNSRHEDKGFVERTLEVVDCPEILEDDPARPIIIRIKTAGPSASKKHFKIIFKGNKLDDMFDAGKIEVIDEQLVIENDRAQFFHHDFVGILMPIINIVNMVGRYEQKGTEVHSLADNMETAINKVRDASLAMVAGERGAADSVSEVKKAAGELADFFTKKNVALLMEKMRIIWEKKFKRSSSAAEKEIYIFEKQIEMIHLILKGITEVPVGRSEEVDLKELISIIAPSINIENVITSEFDRNVSFVRGNKSEIFRILFNLLRNAARATNRRPASVIIKVAAEDADVVIKITDLGPGMPIDKVRAFNNSRSVISTHEGEGHGIGLTIARELTEQNSGTISVQSELGKGTTFTIRLPVAQPPAAGPGAVKNEPVPFSPFTGEEIKPDDISIENELILLNHAAAYLKDFPVDEVIDLSLIPWEDLGANMKTWAYIIALNDKHGLNVNYIFESDNTIYKAEVEKMLFEKIEEIDGIDVKEISARVADICRPGAIQIRIMKKEDLEKLEDIPENVLPVALSEGETLEGTPLRDFMAASTIGLAQAACKRMQKEIEEDHSIAGAVEKMRLLLKKIEKEILPWMQHIYQRLFPDKDIKDIVTKETVLNMIDDNPIVRRNLAIALALPPIIRAAIQSLKDYHEALHRLQRYA